MAEVCAQYGKDIERPILSERFSFSQKHRLLYCRNAKVGTTTWKVSTFFKIPSSEIYPKFNWHMKPTDVFSFFTVRHPFERLVSAYEHKVLRNHAKFLGNISFEYFLTKHVIHEANICPDTNQCMNIHWMPYISACSYCNINYTVIQKMETFEEDQEAIVTIASMNNLRRKK